jgi:hypothetical protein
MSAEDRVKLDRRIRITLKADPGRCWWTLAKWAAFLKSTRRKIGFTDAWNEVIRNRRVRAQRKDPDAVDGRLLMSQS